MKKLFSRNFILILQGNMVSALGDVIYEISLGLWVLATTGSTGIMGTLMGLTVLARVITAPFAGVVVDKWDRKKIMIWMDLLRGVAILVVAICSFYGVLKLWMILVGGIVIGMTSAFFMPAVQSLLPHLVPPDQLIRANGVFSSIHTASGIIGNGIGGFVYQLFGASIAFLFNAISFFLSAISEIFIKVPLIVKDNLIKRNFVGDLKAGLQYSWRNRGIRYLLFGSALINFCSSMGTILLLPLFQNSALGAGKYGLLMATFTAGMFVSSILLSVLKIKSHQRFAIFCSIGPLHLLGMILLPFMVHFYLMASVIFIYGLGLGINSTFMLAAIQLAVTDEMRGKVLSMMGALGAGMIPLGMSLGGILGEVFSIKLIISVSFILILFCYLMFSRMSTIKRLINS